MELVVSEMDEFNVWRKNGARERRIGVNIHGWI